MISRRLHPLLALPLLLGVAACSGDDDPVLGEPTLYSVRIAPTLPSLDAFGATVQLNAAASDDQGNNLDDVTYVWSSGDETVATVSSEGVVTAVADGETEITLDATWEGTTRSATTTVTVDQEADVVELDASADMLAVGETLQLSATSMDANGNPMVEPEYGYESSDEDIATVDEDGLVTAVAEGEVEITVTIDGAEDSVTLTVTAAPAL